MPTLQPQTLSGLVVIPTVELDGNIYRVSLADRDERLDAEELVALVERAEGQRRGLEERRLRATTETFAATE